MTVAHFIDYMIPGDNQAIKKQAREKGIPMGGRPINLHLRKVYVLAEILDVDAPELVVNILDFENVKR
jgi:hypothetical protein